MRFLIQFLLITFFLGVNTTIQGQDSDIEFSTLYGHFSRVFSDGSTIDSTEGDFYYLGIQRMFIEVTYPLHQILTIEDKITTIYYPDHKKAFRLESVNPTILPLIPGIIAAIRPDYGLTDLGFKLLHQELRGDTLFIYWEHPELKDKLGTYKIAEIDDRLILSLYTSPDGKVKSKTTFSNHILLKGISFPQHIRSQIDSPTGSSYEEVILQKLSIDIKIPPEIRNFQIPDDVVVERRTW